MIVDTKILEAKIKSYNVEIQNRQLKQQQLAVDNNKLADEIHNLSGRIQEIQDLLRFSVPGNSVADVKSGKKPTKEA